MKITVRKNGSSDGVTYEGREAREKVREMFKSVTDQMLVPDKDEARKLRHWMADTLRDGRAIWSEMDEGGNPCGNVMTMEPKPVKIMGIIKEDGTFEVAGDLPPEEQERIKKLMAKEE